MRESGGERDKEMRRNGKRERGSLKGGSGLAGRKELLTDKNVFSSSET